MVHLDPVTRLDAASDFFAIENVPHYGISMGIKTIMSSKKIFIVAFSEQKAAVVQKAIEGPFCSEIPATILQKHGDCTFVLDTAVNSLI